MAWLIHYLVSDCYSKVTPLRLAFFRFQNWRWLCRLIQPLLIFQQRDEFHDPEKLRRGRANTTLK
jgi:hypothetical protein